MFVFVLLCQSLLSVSDFAAFFDQFSALNPSLALNAGLSEEEEEYLGKWGFKYPNHTEDDLNEKEEADALAAVQAMRGGRGRGRGYGRRGGPVDVSTVPTQVQLPPSAIATDGNYLFLHTKNGLAKVGSGYGGTRRGHVYAHRYVALSLLLICVGCPL